VPLQLQLAWQRSSAAVLHRTVRLRLQRAHPAVSSFTEPSYGLVAAGPAPAAVAAEQLVASRRRPPSQPAAAAASPAPPAPASPDAQVGSETASASHQASSASSLAPPGWPPSQHTAVTDWYDLPCMQHLHL